MAIFRRWVWICVLGAWCIALPAWAKPEADSFFNLRLGKTTIPGQKLVAERKPVALPQGAALGFYYQDAEIINVARVLTLQGELLLETRSLDAIIWLETENLPKGNYKLEILSGTQRAEGNLVIR